MDSYTIGQVAERSGFSASALRYYEDHGVIAPAARTEAGYRLYDDRSLARLGFIARAKHLGCTLDEITELARLWDDDDCGPVQRRLHDLVTTKISDAQVRSAELIRFTAELQAAAASLGADPVDGPCGETCACLTNPVDTEGRSPASGDPVPLAGADSAVACTLASGEMPRRLADWQDVLGTVEHRDWLPDGGVRLTFGAGTDTAEVARLMVAEQRCCSFFGFALTVDQRGVALEVRAPADASDLVTAVFGSP